MLRMVDLPNVNLYRGTKISAILRQFEEHGLKFFQGTTPKPSFKVLARFACCPWPPQVKNSISVLE